MKSMAPQLYERYLAWLRDETTVREIDDWVEVTTPFLDRHNDYLQIYMKAEDSGFILTDDGYIVNDLEMCGCNLDSPRRKNILAKTLRGFGVQLDLESKALHVYASVDNFAVRKHSLIQAMLAVNDMFMLSSSQITSFFFEDIEQWLSDADIRYSPKIKLTGISGFDHLFDFLIPKSSLLPERILLSINRPDRNSVERTLFAWSDAKDNREADSRAYAILNDSDKEVGPAIAAALSNHKVRPVPWSERDAVREELAA